ncbi:MAG: hypothetical protein ACFE9M_02185 [Promethearchaeota archaeon]
MKETDSYKPKKVKLLAIIFSTVLVFLTFEIPFLIDILLIQRFPDIHPIFYPDEVNAIINSARPIGYLNLIIIIILIIFGLLIENNKISVSSSFLLFLPTFGNFAMYMFFLAGFGILEILWLPLYTPFFNFLTLGIIVFIPAFPFCFLTILTYIPIIQGIIMFIGLYIFTSGVINWFYGKYQKKEIIDFSIYKYSRHPQYLGFLIYSYGVYMRYMTYDLVFVPMSRLSSKASLPWLIFALLIVTVAFIEDVKMSKKYSEKFKAYRKNTPFLIKLPPELKSIITYPMRYIIKKNFPETKKEVAKVVFFYGVIIIILSLPLSIIFSIFS